MATDWDNDYDYEDKGPNFNWTEAQWRRFLELTDSQVRRFIAIYHSQLENPNRLDAVAERMGWLVDSWPITENDGGAGASTPPPPPDAEDLPYTLHLHPVYTVTRGLFQSLRELSMAFARLNQGHPLLQMAFLTTLHEAEVQAILGIESQDMGDMPLTVCHFKRSLAQLNHSMAVLERMKAEQLDGANLFANEAKKRIFDLREVWIRVNSEIREEIKRRDDGKE